jgi:SAM-dependent methyltransferase
MGNPPGMVFRAGPSVARGAATINRRAAARVANPSGLPPLTPPNPPRSNGRMSDWNTAYREKGAATVSWYRPHLDVSLRLLDKAGLTPQTRVIDAGAGASTLVDDLLDRGVRAITLLDLSSEALGIARARLGARAASIRFIVGDVTTAELATAAFDIWHDRAVLHFLLGADDVSAYVRQATRALADGGHAIIGGFAADGPLRCSGRDVARREPEDIAALFGERFELIDAAHESHVTPAGATQRFAYALLRKRPTA